MRLLRDNSQDEVSGDEDEVTELLDLDENEDVPEFEIPEYLIDEFDVE